MKNNLNGNGYTLPEKVAILYSDVKPEYFPTEAQYITEKKALQDAEAVAFYIKKIGVDTVLIPADEDLSLKLRQEKPDMALNLVGSVRGDESLSSSIPGVLELINLPYTGSGVLGEAISYNRYLTKRLLQQSGIPVPHDQLFSTHTEPINPNLRYPLISKLNEIHGSVELTQDAISENEKHLRERLKFLISTYNQKVLVEEYIGGTELTAVLFEGKNKKVYLARKIFKEVKEKYVFADFTSKWSEDPNSITYEKYKDDLCKNYVRSAFDVLKMNDYSKFDIRIDSSGRHYFLDANSNPFFGPKEIGSATSEITELYGVYFSDLLKRLLLNTMRDAEGKELLLLPNGDPDSL